MLLLRIQFKYVFPCDVSVIPFGLLLVERNSEQLICRIAARYEDAVRMARSRQLSRSEEIGLLIRVCNAKLSDDRANKVFHVTIDEVVNTSFSKANYETWNNEASVADKAVYYPSAISKIRSFLSYFRS